MLYCGTRSSGRESARYLTEFEEPLRNNQEVTDGRHTQKGIECGFSME